MFPRYRHTPIFDLKRKRCSICNLPVYSLAGIHPQCAIKIPEPTLHPDGDDAPLKVDAPVLREALQPPISPATPTKSRQAPAAPRLSSKGA